MAILNNEIFELSALTQASLLAPCIGRIAGINKLDDIMVGFDGREAKAAKLISGLDRKKLTNEKSHGREVLLVFENGDPEKPIIIGLMEDRLENLMSLELEEENGEQTKELVVDGKRVTITAQDEVVLKCGKGSIIVRKDGKIIIKGTHIFSRSSGPHRIKGASVNVN